MVVNMLSYFLTLFKDQNILCFKDTSIIVVFYVSSYSDVHKIY